MLLVALLAAAWPAAAQEARGTPSIRSLPRPGYEPRRLRAGPLIISPEFLASALYDSNIYATRADEEDDFIFNLLPRVDAVLDTSKLNLRLDGYLNYRLHAQNSSEDGLAFGTGVSADYSIRRALSTSGAVRFDRAVENRNDPEASQRLKRVRIDNFLGNLGFAYRRNRIGISGNAEAQKVDFLAASEADRDFSSYRGTLAASLLATPRLETLVEGFVNRRDHRTAVDRNGVDRDTTTLGLVGALRIDIADRWKGRVGAGAFRANPDDRTLRSFSGLYADADLTWSPDPRTLFAARVRRGDVATVRAGASGRVDTSASLRWEQEVRHNLLLRTTGGVRETRYRGGSLRRLTQWDIGTELEYLVNDKLSVTASAGHTHRSARFADDRFDRSTIGLGMVFRY